MGSIVRTMKTALCAAAVLSAGWQSPAQAEEVTWRFAHYLQEQHFFAAGWLTDWAEELESRSGGRITVDIRANNSLLRLGDIAPGVREGKAELGFGPAPNSPMLDVLELPFMVESASHGTRVAMALHDSGQLDKDLKGLHTVHLQTNAPSLIHTKDVAVRRPADMQGLRMRGATPYIRDVLTVLGAEPVADYLAPQVYGLLRDGKADGTLWPYEAIRIFNLAEQANHHTEMYFFASVLGLFVNADALAALPPDLQKVVRDMSGLERALSAAAQWDQEEAIGRAIVLIAMLAERGPRLRVRVGWDR